MAEPTATDRGTPYDVAIIGYGPVGATLANQLGQAGWRVAVIERETQIHPLPRAIHFDGEVMRVFQGIGVGGLMSLVMIAVALMFVVLMVGIVFVEQGVRYEYRFCCNRDRFTEEWLFAYPLGRAQKWFHRVFDAESDKDAYKFSTSFLGGRQRQTWAAQTRPNALFFSTAIQLNNEQLKPAFDWFKLRLRVFDSISGFSAGYTLRRCSDEFDRSRIVAFMNSADLSISDIRVKESSFSAEFLPKEMPTSIRDEFLKDMAGKKIVEPRFFHKDVNTQETVEFDESEESDGTRALFAFAGPWLDVLENERVLVVDELDTSLHPLLVHHLVKRLHHEGTKAQLIFTTHDTTLLSQKLLRRDQVWFMEKDEKSATRLYPLSDFSPRDNEAIERGYLNGRYGGIPFLKDLDFYGV